MDVDAELYRSPVEVLLGEISHLKARLVEERAEVARFEGLVGKKADGGLDELIWRADQDAKATNDLIVDFRAAVKVLRAVGK